MKCKSSRVCEIFMKTTPFVHASTSPHVIEFAWRDHSKQQRLRKKNICNKMGFVLTLKARCLTLFFSYNS